MKNKERAEVGSWLTKRKLKNCIKCEGLIDVTSFPVQEITIFKCPHCNNKLVYQLTHIHGQVKTQ